MKILRFLFWSVLTLVVLSPPADARAQGVICCNISIDVGGNWIGAWRDCGNFMRLAPKEQRRIACHELLTERSRCPGLFQMCCEFADEMLDRLRGRSRGLKESQDLIRDEYQDALQKQFDSRDAIFGFSGSGGKFFNSMLGMATISSSAGRTARQMGDWLNTGLGMAQDHKDWKNWTDLFLTSFGAFMSDERVHQEAVRVASERAGRVYDDLIRGLPCPVGLCPRRLPPVDATRAAEEASQAYMDSYATHMRQSGSIGRLTDGLGAALNVIDYWNSSQSLVNDIISYLEARQEAEGLKDIIDDADIQRDLINNHIQFLLEGCENDQPGGMLDLGFEQDSRSRGPSTPSLFANCWGAPAYDGLALAAPPEPQRRTVVHAAFASAIKTRSLSRTANGSAVREIDTGWMQSDSMPELDRASMERAAKTLEDLAVVLEASLQRIETGILPPLSPFIVDGWEEIEPGILYELEKAAFPSLQALLDDMLRSMRLGEEVLVALGTAAAATASNEAEIPDIINTGITLDGFQTFGSQLEWFVTPQGAGPEGRVAGKTNSPQQFVWLTPGTYDVYTTQPEGGRREPMLVIESLKVPDEGAAVLEPSTVRPDIAPWVPELQPSHGWWGVVLTGEPAENRVQWTRALVPMLIPPGTYDLYWKQDFGNAPMLLESGIRVEPGQVWVYTLDSGITLERAGWVPELQSSHGWWGAVADGSPPDEREQWSRLSDFIVLRPGEYDIYWKQNFGNAPMLLHDAVRVDRGTLTSLRADAGVRLLTGPDTPDLDSTHGWWGAVPVGADPSDRIQWSHDKSAPVLVPPGTYDIYWKQDFSSAPVKLVEAVKVEAGQLIELQLDP
jgi:hypothetical protein